MRCSDVERLLPEFIEGIGYPEFQDHLKACPHCSQLVADLKWIASEARHLAESDEPPPRVWANIANQLRSEGIIREPQTAPAHVFVLERRRRSTAWWLAPVAAAIIAAGAYQLTHRAAPPVIQQAAQQPVAQQPSAQPVQPSQPPPASKSQVAQSTPSVERARPLVQPCQQLQTSRLRPLPRISPNKVRPPLLRAPKTNNSSAKYLNALRRCGQPTKISYER